MDLASFLEALPAAQLDSVYASQWTCRALLRALPPLAQLYVARLLLPAAAVPKELVAAWASATGRAKHNAAVAQLRRLQLLQAAGPGGGREGWRLHPAFRTQLRSTVAGSAEPAGVPASDEAAAAAPSVAELDGFVQAQWEGLLLYLADSSVRPPPLPAALAALDVAAGGEASAGVDIDELFQEADLMGADGGGGRVITQSGYTFLLRGPHEQLWALLRRFIALQQRRSGTDLAAAVSFLLQLGFRPAGRPLRLDGLPTPERRIAAALAHLGLLCPFRVGEETWASPTRLALVLAGGGGGGSRGGSAAADAAAGTIIVETNYRVYAYGGSALQAALLRLFVRCEAVLPGLWVGTLTRESIIGALRRGLRAEDLIGYMRERAHPRVAARTPIVPEVVSDQVRLWQADTQRVRAVPAVLYSGFESPGLWGGTNEKAKQLGSHLWDAAPRAAGADGTPAFSGALVSQAGTHAELRDHIRALKAKGV